MKTSKELKDKPQEMRNPGISDPEVCRLVDSGSHIEDVDAAMASLQRRLRGRDDDAAKELVSAINDTALDPEARALALEALSTARSPAYTNLVIPEVRDALRSRHDELRFAGLASLSDLPATERVAFRITVRDLLGDPDPDVRAAACAELSGSSPIP